MMGLIINIPLGNAWNILTLLENGDCIDIGILQTRVVTMLGKAFSQPCFVFVEWCNELGHLGAILVIDIGDEVLMSNRNFGQGEGRGCCCGSHAVAIGQTRHVRNSTVVRVNESLQRR